jgi:ribonuclease HI
MYVNFDGSVKSNHQAADGFVIRDDHSNPILDSSTNLGYANVLVVEVMALREGLRQAVCKGFSNLLVEGDSQILLHSINGKMTAPGRI